MPRAWVGTSGYDYDHWRHAFYPPDMPRANRLAFYAQRFDAVEINATFYGIPSHEMVARWARETPPGFRFVAKGSQFLTHRKHLKDAREPLQRLFSPLQRLGPRLAGILWQLPGRWRADPERRRGFVRELQALSPRAWWHAFEFRHGSWLHGPVFGILREANMGVVLSDMPFQVLALGPRRATSRAPSSPRPSPRRTSCTSGGMGPSAALAARIPRR